MAGRVLDVPQESSCDNLCASKMTWILSPTLATYEYLGMRLRLGLLTCYITEVDICCEFPE
jgi:hypothetical protein